jgi:tRNA G46 methylase TrmB
MNVSTFFDDNNYDKNIFYYPKSFNKHYLLKYKRYLTIQWRKPWPKERKGQNRILGNGEEIVEKLDYILNKYKIFFIIVFKSFF